MKWGTSGMIAVALIGGLCVLGAYVWTPTAILLANQQEAEWRALKNAEAALERGRVPHAWQFGFFLSTNAINEGLRLLEGTSVRHSALQTEHGALELKLLAAKLDTSRGAPIVTIGLAMQATTASGEPKGPAAILTGAGEFALQSIERNPTDREGAIARFRIVPLALVPQLKWGWFDLGKRNLLASPGVSVLIEALGEHMVLPISYREVVDLKLPLDKEETTPIKKGDDQIGSITLQSSSSIPTLRQPFSIDLLAVGPQGIWLLGDRAERRAKSSTPAPPPAANLRTALEELRKDVASRLETHFSSAADASMWIHKQVFTDLVGQLAVLPAESRVIRIRSTKVTGHLAEEKWHADLLGDGGFVVDLVGTDAISGTIRVGSVRSEWKAKQGLDLSAFVDLDLKARIHAHLDPIVGGGIGTTVGMEGSAKADLSGRVIVEPRDILGRKTITSVFALRCALVPVEILTDGRLVIDTAWTKVPKIGATIGQKLGDKAPKPSVLLSAVPQRVPLDSGKPKEELSVRYPLPAIDVTFAPLESRFEDDGLLVKTGLRFSPAPQRDWSSDEAVERQKFDDAVQALEEKPLDTCPPDSGIRVHLGAFEFGPNNEIIKFLNELRKLGKIPEQELKRIGNEVSTKKVEGWVADPADSFRRSEPGKVLEKVNEGLKKLNPF